MTPSCPVLEAKPMGPNPHCSMHGCAALRGLLRAAPARRPGTTTSASCDVRELGEGDLLAHQGRVVERRVYGSRILGLGHHVGGVAHLATEVGSQVTPRDLVWRPPQCGARDGRIVAGLAADVASQIPRGAAG